MHKHDSDSSSIETDVSRGASKIQCTVAENVHAQLWHIIERLSAETCCFCRILWVPVKEMTQKVIPGAL